MKFWRAAVAGAPRWSFVTLFFALALAPLLQTLTGAVSVAPIVENRTLAPGLAADTPLEAAPRALNAWYADHFGFRPWLIRAKTQIDYSLFGTSDRVLVGKHGQLFYRRVLLQQEPEMQALLKTKAAAALAGIEKLCAALRERDVRCAFVVPMMSDRYYPELLPDNVPPRAHPLRIDDFVAKLAKLPDVTYIDADAILREAIKTRRIFNLTDFHWNYAAAFDVAKALVDRISEAQGLPASPWTHPLEIELKHESGGIATFMPLFAPPYEDQLMVKRNWATPAGFQEVSNDGPYESRSSATSNPRLLPPVLAVGDSFFDGMQMSGIPAMCEAFHRIRWRSQTPWMPTEIVAAIPPDTRWVVFEFIEVSARTIAFFADDANLEKAIAAWRARGSR